MTVQDIATGRVINLTVNETQLDLIEDESFSFDPDEDFDEFDPGSVTTTQRIPGRNAPSFEFESRIDRAEFEGLEELGFIDADGSYQFGAERNVDEITAEFLDDDDGSVEITFTFEDCETQFDSVDDDSPLLFSATVHVNGGLQITDGTE